MIFQVSREVPEVGEARIPAGVSSADDGGHEVLVGHGAAGGAIDHEAERRSVMKREAAVATDTLGTRKLAAASFHRRAADKAEPVVRGKACSNRRFSRTDCSSFRVS